MDWNPPSLSARAPYDTRRPPLKCPRIAGCVLSRCISSNGDSHGLA